MPIRPPPHVIAVVNQKGGVGKTTLCIELAVAAHLDRKRTRILDLDSQGSAFDWFAARNDGSRLDGLGVVKADRVLTVPKFRELAGDHEVVICDGPARLGNVTQAAAVAADVVVIPFRPGPFDWWASAETLALLDAADDIRAQLERPPVRRVLVLNGAQQRTKIAAHALDALRELGQIAPLVIFNRVAFADVGLAGETVLTADPTSPAASEIRALWAAVAPSPAIPPTEEPSRAA